MYKYPYSYYLAMCFGANFIYIVTVHTVPMDEVHTRTFLCFAL